MPEPEIVWLTEIRTFGFLIYRGAYFSYVRYNQAGIVFEVLVENDEYVFREEDQAIEHESE